VQGGVHHQRVRQAVGEGQGRGANAAPVALGSSHDLGIRQFHLYATDAGAPMYVSEGFTLHDRFMVLPVSVGAH
jgi:hypothetical protein